MGLYLNVVNLNEKIEYYIQQRLQMRLPFNTDTPFHTYPIDAYISGVLLAKNDYYLPFLLSNYIETYFVSASTGWNITYERNLQKHTDVPFCTEMIGIPYVLTHKDIIDYRAVIKRAIDIGWYPILDLQLLSLPYYNVYDKIRERSKGKTAEVAIVGYEDDGRKMYVRYFIDALYTEELIPCGDIFFGQQSPPPMQRRFRFIVPQKEKKSGFDITSVKKELHNYLFSLPVQTNGITHGLNAFRGYAEFAGTRYEQSQRLNMITVRFIREHKTIMLKRLQYMLANNFIKNGSIVKRYSIVTYVAEKIHEICCLSNPADTAKEMILHMCNIEEKLLTEVYNELCWDNGKIGGRAK